MKKILLVLLCMILILTAAGCKSSDYKKAGDLMKQGQYQEAMAAYQELGNYKDSETLVTECKYQIALGLLNQKAYQEAREAFLLLGDYKEAALKAAECDRCIREARFEEAVAAFNAGEYDKAKQQFEELRDLEGSADYLTRIADLELSRDIAGLWKTSEIDLAVQLYAAISKNNPTMQTVIENLEKKTLMAEVKLELDADGNAHIYAVLKDTQPFVDAFPQLLTDYVLLTLETALKEEGFTLQDLYDEIGSEDIDVILMATSETSIDQLMEEAGLADIMEQFASGLAEGKKGSWVVQDGTISVTIDDSSADLTYLKEQDQLHLVNEKMKTTFGQSEFDFARDPEGEKK